MRYATLSASAAREARSRRIGRCARCHAPVLAEDEHYGEGQAIVHGACGSEPPTSGHDPGPEARVAPAARRIRRMAVSPSFSSRLETSDF
jgi:hypothetical protein